MTDIIGGKFRWEDDTERADLAFAKGLKKDVNFISEVKIDDPFYIKWVSTHKDFEISLVRDMVDNMNSLIQQLSSKQKNIIDAMIVGYPESECIYLTLLTYKRVVLRFKPINHYCVIENVLSMADPANKNQLTIRIRPQTMSD